MTALCEWTSQAELVGPRLLALGSSRAAHSAPSLFGLCADGHHRYLALHFPAEGPLLDLDTKVHLQLEAEQRTAPD